MTSKNLHKLLAKLEAGLLSSNDQAKHYDDLKSALMKLSAKQSKFMAQKNPQTFSSWPPEMPERKCSWRLSDELQAARLRVPEPYDFKKNTVMKIPMMNRMALTSWIPDNCEPVLNEMPVVTLKRRAFETEDGSTFYAWTADGSTPIFPIPL